MYIFNTEDTMALNETVSVWILTESKPIKISCTSNPFTAEDLCKLLCQKCNISPLTRTLFALRIKDTDHFLKDNSNVLSSSREYELRIRVKVPRLETLMSLDENTYNYYYLQAKRDVNNEKVPEIKYPVHKEKLLGLGITDMARAVSEENMTLSDIEKNTKNFIPKVLLRKHWHFAKKHARMTLPLLCKQGYVVSHLKNSYLKELYTLAPNYLSEEFDNVIWQNGTDITPIRVVVAAFDPKQPGITFVEKATNKEIHACTIEELIYLTRNGDRSLEISRRGTPLFLKFKSEEQLSSFISLCDLYYRLMVKWTFNLSKDDETPSLKELHRTKCHGPVGGAFSYRKLEEKRGKKHGCYILRECQDDYNVYYLDVCTKSSTTETYKIEFKGDRYIFNGEEYYSLERLVKCHENPDGRIYLNECIPPSEYDKSQLLLCGEQVRKGVRIDQAELQELLKDNRSPRCLPNKDIMLYQGSEKFGSEGLTATYKAFWKLNETKKLLVAFKRLHGDRGNDYLKDFIDLASKWACIQSSSIVRLYGVTLGSPTAMVLEYLPLGSFSEYLRAHGAKVRPLQLLKASASVARALWDLSEAGVVHGNIRAHRLLLAAIDTAADRIVVKLAGPSLHRYTKHDVHWIPVQFYDVMDMSRRSVAGDIWAFATTLWEIFSYGQSPTETNPVLTAKSYEGGERLHRPKACPSEVYALMRQCWQPDPLRPQEIMRDINHMLYREYIPTNDYEEPKINLDPDNVDTVSSDRFIPSEISDAGSNKSLISMNSSFPSMNGTMSDHYDNNFADNRSSGSLENAAANGCGASLRSFGSSSAANDDLDAGAPRLMESVVSQGMPYLVTLTKKIGSGTYGHVYRGWMEKDNQESQRKEVAVKKLTRHASERNGTLLEDFKNELEIMKSLQHVNIVEILGYSWDGSSDVLIVMEYLEEGSLNYYLKFRGDKLRISHLLQYAKDIATGMDHMSAKNIVHRDLATRNILVVNRHHVKISDFGLARIIPKEESSYRLKTSRLLPFNWYAPESAVEPFHFSTKSDVWSYGVTVWEIFTRARVDVPRFDLERPQHRAECFEMPDDCPPEVYRYLMKDCWELDPSRRPRFIDLILKCKMLMEKT